MLGDLAKSSACTVQVRELGARKEIKSTFLSGSRQYSSHENDVSIGVEDIGAR